MNRLLFPLLAALALALAPMAVHAGDYGACGTDSDCHSYAPCRSGRCADAEGGSCGTDSECGGRGAMCNSGKCTNAPDGTCRTDSECPDGSCSSGKCK